MSLRRAGYLMTTSLAVVALVATPMQAYAQDAGPPLYTQSQSEDPPALVGRVATIEGTVSYHAASETEWSPAVLNAPVTNGDGYWTQPQATAEIEVGASSLWLDSSTELDIATLDGTALTASQPQGELYVHLRSLQPGESYTIETPRGSVTMAAGGRYEIDAGDTQDPTTVTVLDGTAQVSAEGVSLQVQANQTATVTGDGTFQGSVGPLVQDPFLSAMQQRERPAAPQGVAAPPVVAQMTGGEDLNAYGTWQDNQDYGQVWYPQVASDWVPYREGRWSYIAPWGWTWVDAAPWGFAPFHYGRWVQVGPRWGWAPVYPGYSPAYRPVYAPALVTFFGIGAGVALGVGIGFGLGAAYGPGANVGWVPLGPREPYFPPYRVSRVYVNRVNVTNIRNVTNIYNQAGARRALPIGNYANARAATLVPARTMADSQPVRQSFRQPNAADLARTHGLVDRAPIAPTGRTLGLSPRVAQRLKVSDVTPGRAPGPKLRPAASVAQTGRPARPALRPAAPGARPAATPLAQTRPNAVRPTPAPAERTRPGAPGPAINRPAGGEIARPGLPPLRQPGARPTERPAMTPNRPQGARPGESAVPGPKIAPRGEARPVPRGPTTAPTARPPTAQPAARPATPHAAPARAERPAPTRPSIVERRQPAQAHAPTTQQREGAAQARQHADQQRQRAAPARQQPPQQSERAARPQPRREDKKPPQ
jgi:hypothetical protein